MLTRRPLVRYLIVCVLLVTVYIYLLPYDESPAQLKDKKPTAPDANAKDDGRHPVNDKGIPLKDSGAPPPDEEQRLREQDIEQKINQGLEVSENDVSKPGQLSAHDKALNAHFKEIFDVFHRHAPDVKKLDNYKDGERAGKKGFNDKTPVFSNKELGEFLQVSDEDVAKLKKSHEETVKELPKNFPEGLYKGRGIVTVAGGALMPVLVTTMKMLRRVSPHIPVEIFVADQEEYEPEICEQVLPALNVKCRILKDVYGEELWNKFEIHGYQLKVLSMLASSFDENLFLDADSVPLLDIEQVFEQEPFTSTGYVIWPDFWFRTTSPKFYEIAGVTLGQRVRGDLSVTDPDQIPQADLEGALPDKSTESGQILFHKSKHYKALLLTTYYNLNGYTAYYPLFTQGGGGEGDKETFLAALEVLKEPYHQIKSDNRPAGYFDDNNEFHGTGMLQVNPLDDYKKHVVKTSNANPKILFMHLNYPKVNPRDLFYSDIFAKYYKSDEDRIRFYGKPSGNYWVFDYKDIELQVWQDHEWALCELGVKQGIRYKDWTKHNADVNEMCEMAKKHVAWLKKTHDT